MSAQIRSAQHLQLASDLPRNACHVGGALLAGGHCGVLQGAGGVAIVCGGQKLQKQKEAAEPLTHSAAQDGSQWASNAKQK